MAKRGRADVTDKRIKEDCPFCHTPAERIQIIIYEKRNNHGYIYCPNCGCQFSGEGKQNLIDMWNRR